MGLDIGAFANALEYVGAEYQDDWDEEAVLGVDSVGFEERLDGYAPGYYRPAGESLGFRAGSYSGYNQWRERLSRFALHEPASAIWQRYNRTGVAPPTAPFVELINFSDCEGAIGPVTSAKLADDFTRHRQAMQERTSIALGPSEAESFMELYDRWAAAFTLAAKTGWVTFG